MAESGAPVPRDTEKEAAESALAVQEQGGVLGDDAAERGAKDVQGRGSKDRI